MIAGAQFEIDTDPASVQLIAPLETLERFEGVSFSSTGDVLAVATSENNTVLLFRRKPDGRFEEQPYCTIGGANSRLAYPHDVSFSTCGKLLAVAQRRGAIAIYQKSREGEGYGPEPVFEISGRKSKLALSDGVAFVPPHDRYLAACNLQLGTIAFYRRISSNPLRFKTRPEFELRHPSLQDPDGLAFSSDGKWLATANHGNHSVCVFQRQNRFLGRPLAILARARIGHQRSADALSPLRRLYPAEQSSGGDERGRQLFFCVPIVDAPISNALVGAGRVAADGQ